MQERKKENEKNFNGRKEGRNIVKEIEMRSRKALKRRGKEKIKKIRVEHNERKRGEKDKGGSGKIVTEKERERE